MPNYILQTLKKETSLPSIATAMRNAFTTLDNDILGGVFSVKSMHPEYLLIP